MECSLPGSSVHGILQARILEWVANLFSGESFPTQGPNPGLLHRGQDLHRLSPRRGPHGGCCHRSPFLGPSLLSGGWGSLALGTVHSTQPCYQLTTPNGSSSSLILLTLQSHSVSVTTAAFSDSLPLAFRVFSSSNSWPECLASSFTFANHDVAAHPRTWFCTCFSYLYSLS